MFHHVRRHNTTTRKHFFPLSPWHADSQVQFSAPPSLLPSPPPVVTMATPTSSNSRTHSGSLPPYSIKKTFLCWYPSVSFCLMLACERLCVKPSQLAPPRYPFLTECATRTTPTHQDGNLVFSLGTISLFWEGRNINNPYFSFQGCRAKGK